MTSIKKIAESEQVSINKTHLFFQLYQFNNTPLYVQK